MVNLTICLQMTFRRGQNEGLVQGGISFNNDVSEQGRKSLETAVVEEKDHSNIDARTAYEYLK